jgi:hypothetical protein
MASLRPRRHVRRRDGVDGQSIFMTRAGAVTSASSVGRASARPAARASSSGRAHRLGYLPRSALLDRAELVVARFNESSALFGDRPRVRPNLSSITLTIACAFSRRRRRSCGSALPGSNDGDGRFASAVAKMTRQL